LPVDIVDTGPDLGHRMAIFGIDDCSHRPSREFFRFIMMLF
jgi:hypothetical protein